MKFTYRRNRFLCRFSGRPSDSLYTILLQCNPLFAHPCHGSIIDIHAITASHGCQPSRPAGNGAQPRGACQHGCGILRVRMNTSCRERAGKCARKNPGSILEMMQVLLEMERALHPDANTPPAHSMRRYVVRQTVFHAAGQADQPGGRADVLVDLRSHSAEFRASAVQWFR